METIQALIEGTRPLPYVVRLVTDSMTKPIYNDGLHLILQIEYANSAYWGGVAIWKGVKQRLREPYGIQKTIPGLIVPFGVQRSEWEWNRPKD